MDKLLVDVGCARQRARVAKSWRAAVGLRLLGAVLGTVLGTLPVSAPAVGLDLDWLSHPIRLAGPAPADTIGAEFATLQREGRLALLTELTDRPARPVALDPARLLAAIDSPMLLLRVAAADRPDLTRDMVERILRRREPAVLRTLVVNRAVSLNDADRTWLRSAGDPDIVAWLDQEERRERDRAQARTAAATATKPDVPIAQARLALATAGYNETVKITQRPDFQPTAEEVARGLASRDVVLRRHWHDLASFHPSPEQVEAGLTDPDPTVRQMTLARADVRPTPAQLDRACSDPDFSVRYRCVQRPDVELTQALFERLLLDPNGNMLGVFTSGRRALSAAQWAPLVDAALASGSARVRRALADSALPMSREQMLRGAQAAEPDVRKAYCNRRLMLCSTSP